MARLPAAGKTIAVVLALILAGAATFAIFTYVRGLEQRAFEDAELVEVFVAQETIPAGTSASAAGEAGLIARDTAPRSTVPVGAITSLEQIAGLVTFDRVIAGEVIVADRWVTPGEAVVEFEIPEGFEAISVQVGLVPGVAGFIRPGDHVSLIASVTAPGTGPDEVDEEGQPVPVEPENRSQYVLQDVEVLAVGRRVASEEQVQEGDANVLLTLALVPEDAERLVFAIENASLHFTLLPEGAEPPATPGRTLDDLFS